MNNSSPLCQTSSQKLSALRDLMKEEGIQAFLIPHDDEYLGEQIPASAERLKAISNFSGSAGIGVVTLKDAYVFSDGRYSEQLKAELLPQWQGKHILQTPPEELLKEKLKAEDIIGYDPKLLSLPSLHQWEKAGFKMKALEKNLIDMLWEKQPNSPQSEIVPHELSFAGQKSAEKRKNLGKILSEKEEAAFLCADSSVTAWILNLRAQDLPNLPIALGYALFHQNGEAEFFADPARLKGALEDEKITLFPPEKLSERLKRLKGQKIRISPNETPVWLKIQIETAGAEAVYGENPALLPRAIKNETEIQGHKKAQLLDGAALVRFLSFLKKEGVGFTEDGLAEKLDSLRLENPDCRSLSFTTISAAGANAALPHYHVQKGAGSPLKRNQIYLVDSGGQYKFGTTDCTRTVWSGPDSAPAEIKDRFTRVLKGNIALSMAHFPDGTPGYRLDAFARLPLWEAGLDYDHGTGHGIGSYLSVHEGPHSISSAPRPVGIRAGMIISNEPGYYEAGAYGIRIENLILAVKDREKRKDKEFLHFETLTFVPIDRDLIEPRLLSPKELFWLNRYHAETFKRLSPFMEKDPETLAWLEQACAKIEIPPAP